MKSLEAYRDKFFEEWYGFNSTGFFVLLCLLYLAVFMLKRVFIISDIAAFEILQERGEMWVFDIFFGLQHFSVPVWLAWKFTLTAFIIWVGCFMFGYRITFNQIWRWVMFCELIFVIPELLKFLWFLVVASDPIYEDVVAFYPLSLINLFDHQSIPDNLVYPLKAINVFEFAYWFALVIGVFYLSRKKWRICVYVILSSYCLFFVLWLAFYSLVYK